MTMNNLTVLQDITTPQSLSGPWSENFSDLILSPVEVIAFIDKTLFTHNNQTKGCCLNAAILESCVIDLGEESSQEIDLKDAETYSYYDLAMFCKGSIDSENNAITGAIINRKTIFTNSASHKAGCLIPGDTDTVLNINLNSKKIGSIYFFPGSIEGSVVFNTTVYSIPGDLLTIETTLVFSETLEDILINISTVVSNVS